MNARRGIFFKKKNLVAEKKKKKEFLKLLATKIIPILIKKLFIDKKRKFLLYIT